MLGALLKRFYCHKSGLRCSPRDHPHAVARGGGLQRFYISNGVEVVNRAGYLQPESVTSLLNVIVHDPSLENTACLIAVTPQRNALIPADKANFNASMQLR
jgi:hypothetical protein